MIIQLSVEDSSFASGGIASRLRSAKMPGNPTYRGYVPGAALRRRLRNRYRGPGMMADLSPSSKASVNTAGDATISHWCSRVPETEACGQKVYFIQQSRRLIHAVPPEL
jgi:hypothetical protein